MDGIKLTYKRNKWQVVEDYTVRVLSEDLLIPKGFKTDLASVPRILWSVFPPFGKYNTAAVVHDYLYKTKRYSRQDSDVIFLETMRLSKVGLIQRHLFFYAVRMFGWFAYNKKCKFLTKTHK
jgi:hypothetical protein